jgi:hypothetical protein
MDLCSGNRSGQEPRIYVSAQPRLVECIKLLMGYRSIRTMFSKHYMTKKSFRIEGPKVNQAGNSSLSRTTTYKLEEDARWPAIIPD